MRLRGILRAVALSLLASAAGRGLASEPIRLRPGQCILIGAQEVCALKGDDAAPEPAKPQPTRMATCKYGDNADEPGMKGYTLYQIVIKEDGSKSETAVKTFGALPHDKSECEKEAARLDWKNDHK